MNVETLKTFIETDLLGGRAVSTDENLLLSGLVDSLGVARLVAFIETKWDLKVPARDVKLANFKSVDAISAYLAGRKAA